MKSVSERPQKIYRYGKLEDLRRSLTTGEFVLKSARGYNHHSLLNAQRDDEIRKSFSVDPREVWLDIGGKKVHPLDESQISMRSKTDFLMMSFSSSSEYVMFEEFHAEACLIIHRPDEFFDHFTAVAERKLKGWIVVDDRVTYGAPSTSGVWFTKDRSDLSYQEEWRIVFVPPYDTGKHSSYTVQVGSVEGYSELISRDEWPNK